MADEVETGTPAKSAWEKFKEAFKQGSGGREVPKTEDLVKIGATVLGGPLGVAALGSTIAVGEKILKDNPKLAEKVKGAIDSVTDGDAAARAKAEADAAMTKAQDAARRTEQAARNAIDTAGATARDTGAAVAGGLESGVGAVASAVATGFKTLGKALSSSPEQSRMAGAPFNAAGVSGAPGSPSGPAVASSEPKSTVVDSAPPAIRGMSATPASVDTLASVAASTDGTTAKGTLTKSFDAEVYARARASLVNNGLVDAKVAQGQAPALTDQIKTAQVAPGLHVT